MKKFIICFLILCGIFYIKKDQIVIPNDAIRMRVIANSNSDYDQSIKIKVKNNIETQIYSLLKDTKSTNEARNIIKNNLSEFDQTVNKTLIQNNYNQIFNVNFGKNYFPLKTYKGIEYPEGYYESLVVTIGEGKGDNWWCVMFPPFCLIEAQNENTSNIEYKWLIKDLINKYF